MFAEARAEALQTAGNSLPEAEEVLSEVRSSVPSFFHGDEFPGHRCVPELDVNLGDQTHLLGVPHSRGEGSAGCAKKDSAV